MYVASEVLMNKLVHIIIIINVFTSLCYANIFFTSGLRWRPRLVLYQVFTWCGHTRLQAIKYIIKN